MCSSENELIHDVRQVHLEELIMKNEEQFVMIRLPLTDEHVTAIRREHIGGPILDPADMFERQAKIVGTPIPPCADVETVVFRITPHSMPEDPSYLRAPPSPSDCSEHELYVDALIRRTDMEAQVAKVVAEKDAEIGRLRGILTEIAESDGIDNALDPDRNKRIAYQNLQTDLNEGSGA